MRWPFAGFWALSARSKANPKGETMKTTVILIALAFLTYGTHAAAQDRPADILRVLQENPDAVLPMVRVEGGSFTMGCKSGRDRDCDDDERPAHQVSLPSFEMGRHEVTQALWEAVMGDNPSKFEGCPRCPVERVRWDDGQRFLMELSTLTGKRYRLPTEAEWEYAARGGQQGSGYPYAGSSEPGVVAWYRENSDRRTHPVEDKQPNELGLYDMSGNVREWVQDCWNDSFAGAPGDGRAWEAGDCNVRVVRGGSWFDMLPGYLRSANRFFNPTSDDDNHLGFRVARTLAP